MLTERERNLEWHKENPKASCVPFAGIHQGNKSTGVAMCTKKQYVLVCLSVSRVSSQGRENRCRLAFGVLLADDLGGGRAN